MIKAGLKFLADENIPWEVILKLKQEGFDVISISETDPGLEDKDILSKSYDENKVLITFDNDFGELIFKNKAKSKGVILLKIHPQNVDYIFSILKKALYLDVNFSKHFCVIQPHRIRIITL